MKSLLLATALSLTLAQTMFQCAPDTLQWKNDLGCIKLDPSSTGDKYLYDIRLCSDFVNTYCPTSDLPDTQGVEVLCTTPPSEEIEPKDAAETYPGDPCTTGTQCLSETCTMGYCIGTAQGSACEQDSECNPGNFCDVANTKTCIALLGADAACDRDVMCQMNMGCNNGKCTPYFSVAASGAVSDCGDNAYPNFPLSGTAGIQFSVFCTSGVCNTDGTTCSSSLTSTNALPVPCTPGQGGCATSSTTGVAGNTNCDFGKNPNGSYFCAAEMGDQPYLDFMTWFTGTYIPLVSANPGICHTLHRHLEPVCLNLLGGSYLQNQWTINYNNAKNYAVYAKSDTCTKQIIEPEVFNPTQANLFCDTSFSCAANLTFTTAQGCIQQSAASKTFAVRPCTDYVNSFCPNVHYYHQLDNEVQCYQPTSAPAVATGGYPGDLCGVNSQCLSNICTSGKCAGNIAGSDCDYDSDCEVGLYCETGVTGQCQALIAIGKTCTASQQCVMNAGCNFANGPTGTCVAYYSVETSDTNFVSDCGAGTFLPGGSSILQGNGYMVYYSAFCQSGTCEMTGQGAKIGYCVNSYAQSSPIPTTCTFLKTDCGSSNGVAAGTTYTSCGCGRASGSRYCTLDLGDQPFVNLMQWSQGFINSNTTNCHTLRRGLDPVCMLINDMGSMYTVMQFNERYYMATHYPILVDASNCTQQVYMPQYWAAKQYNTNYYSNQNPPQPDFALYGFVASALVLVLS